MLFVNEKELNKFSEKDYSEFIDVMHSVKWITEYMWYMKLNEFWCGINSIITGKHFIRQQCILYGYKY